MKPSVYNPNEPTENQFRERRVFHPDDERLRACGFKIHARPERGEASWERAGKVLGESAALDWMFEEEARRESEAA
jgi:hypothetical protein